MSVSEKTLLGLSDEEDESMQVLSRETFYKAIYEEMPMCLTPENVPEPNRSTPELITKSGSLHRHHMSWATPGSNESKCSPVHKSAYSSLPQSSAVMFLASFAECDSSSSGPIEIYEGLQLGDYTVGKVIGRGSYSSCREGFKTENPSKRVAFKIVQSEGIHDVVEHEIDVWSRLQHEGFLPLLDIIRLKDVTIIVSPLAEKGSMLNYLKNNGPLAPEKVKPIFKILCQALHHLHVHHRIVHHDIKLENILIDAEFNAYLCDFGLSEFVDDSNNWCLSLKSSQEDLLLKGSLWYLPPEIIDCSRTRRYSFSKDRLTIAPDFDWKFEKTKIDVWAMGIVLYAMITGSLPFTDDYLPRLHLSITSGDYPDLEDADEDLADLISSLLTVDVDSRPLISEILQHRWLQ